MRYKYTEEVVNQILDTLPIRVFWKNRDGVYLGCNLPFCFDDGCDSPKDVIGKTDYDLQPTKEQAEKYRMDDFEVVSSGVAKLGILEQFRPKKNPKEVFWLRTNKVPLRDHNNEIVGVLGTYEEVTPIIDAENRSVTLHKELQYRATHDFLTGLLNRQEFEIKVEKAIKTKATFVLAFIDLDKFKLVNDTSGHKAGDELLRGISQLFLSSLRGSDSVGRLGGDEFGILLFPCSLENAIGILDSIRLMVDNFRFTRNNFDFHVSTSIGCVEGNANTTVSELMNNADTACYIAKAFGGNRISQFNELTMNSYLFKEEASVAINLPKYIKDNKFNIYRQKIYCVSNKCSTCLYLSDFCNFYEIFLRPTEDKDTSTIFKVAERYQMSSMLDKWTIEKALNWLLNQSEVQCISINISHQTCIDLSILDFLKPFSDRNTDKKIWFEIPENTFIQSEEIIKELILRLKALNFFVAIDNFGSGLGSFKFLKSRNIDAVKIDRKLFQNIQNEEINREIINATVQIAKKLNKITIALGVSVEDLSYLQSLNIDFYQINNDEKTRVVS